MPTGQFPYLKEKIVPQVVGFSAISSYVKIHFTFSKDFFNLYWRLFLIFFTLKMVIPSKTDEEILFLNVFIEF